MAELAIQGVELPIDVADTDVVQVDHSQPAYARPRERFNSPRTDTAHPHDADMSLANPPGTVLAKEPLDPPKACLKLLFFQIHRAVGYLSGRKLPSQSLRKGAWGATH